MGTRCHIGVRKGNKVDFIYCGHDGYVDGIGELLIDRFNSIENARKLIDLGNVSWVYDCSENKAEEYMEHYTKEWELVEVIPGVFACVEKGTKSYSIPAAKYVEFGKNQTIEDSIMIEYWYLFEDGEWMVSKGGDVANYISVKEALKNPELVESRRPRGRMLSELFNKHYPDDDEIIYVVGPYVYDANGNTELDGYDSCDAFTDYDSARKFAQYNLANKSEDDVYFPIFKVEREEWENGLEGCLTDDMIVGIAMKDPLLMKGRRYGDFDYRYMPKSVTGSGEYSQRIQNWAHIDESNHPRGRMLRESITAMAVEYVIGRELFDGKWWPIIVYLNESPNRYWYEAICADEGGVYHTELGKGYLSRIRPGTDKCDPDAVEAVEDEFFDQFDFNNVPTHRLDSVGDFKRYAPTDKKLISRD